MSAVFGRPLRNTALRSSTPPAVLTPRRSAGCGELDPAGKNQLLARVVNGLLSLERLLPDLSQARGQQPVDGIRRVCHTPKSVRPARPALSRRCAELEAV